MTTDRIEETYTVEMVCFENGECQFFAATPAGGKIWGWTAEYVIAKLREARQIAEMHRRKNPELHCAECGRPWSFYDHTGEPHCLSCESADSQDHHEQRRPL